MRLSSFAMIKNVAALLPPFLDQLATFFDYSAILDQQPPLFRSLSLVPIFAIRESSP
jgi:hypothetical protein